MNFTTTTETIASSLVSFDYGNTVGTLNNDTFGHLCAHEQGIPITIFDYANVFLIGTLYGSLGFLIFRYCHNRYGVMCIVGAFLLCIAQLLDSITVTVNVAIATAKGVNFSVVMNSIVYVFLAMGHLVVFFAIYFAMYSYSQVLTWKRIIIPPVVCTVLILVLAIGLGIPIDIIILKHTSHAIHVELWKCLLVLPIILLQIGIAVVLVWLSIKLINSVYSRLVTFVLFLLGMLFQIVSIILFSLEDFTTYTSNMRWCKAFRYTRLFCNFMSLLAFFIPIVLVYVSMRRNYRNIQSYRELTQRFLEQQAYNETNVGNRRRAQKFNVNLISNQMSYLPFDIVDDSYIDTTSDKSMLGS
jgi:hypothetical protein